MPRIAALLCLLALAGCGPFGHRYNVWTTGYTGGVSSAVARGAAVAVLPSPTAANPLLEDEVVGKVGRALTGAGYRVVPVEQADLIVTLRYGGDRRVEHGEEVVIQAGQTTEIKDSTGKVIGTATGPTTATAQPTVTTVETLWLTLTARDARPAASGAATRPRWIGEVQATQMNLPLREAVDYLIPPAVAAFGQNQLQQRWQPRRDDPAALALRTR